jgi:cell wall-associated NlpC family hydrolase
VAESWIGTPCAPNSAVKGPGGGVSCHNLVAAVLVECGCLPAFDVPQGRMDWARHNSTSIIEAYMDAHPSFERIVVGDQLQPGDILGYQYGRCVHHLSLALDRGELVHVFRQVGAIKGTINDPTFSSRLKRIWRPKL